jgi:predicted enzyme related to lactoylglutathione lyase
MPSIFANLILDVQDLDRSIAFYSGLLSLPLMRQDAWEGHRLAYLSTGKTEILLLQQPMSEQNPGLERSGGLVIKFEVNDLPVVAKRLQAKRIKVLRDLEMAPFGERTFLVADPDGYAVLLSEPSDGTVH